MGSITSENVDILSQPLTLACGLVFPNRLVKAAMAEGMANEKKHAPSIHHYKAYREWAEGGWGCVLTGNVQVDVRHLNGPKDVGVSMKSFDRQDLLDEWMEWSSTCQGNGTPAIMQINHPGRQSSIGSGTRGYCEKALAPSAVPLEFGPSMIAWAIRSFMFGTPQEMNLAQIDTVIDQFVTAAKLAAKCGFKGVEVHAAHGYLLSQFCSPKVNRRTDEFGGSPAKRVEIILRILRKIRKETPASFCLGIKLNSADHDSDIDDALSQIDLIQATGIDFLEISGGTYEDPTMMTANNSPPQVKESTLAREAFFIEFTTRVRHAFPKLTILLTGGFRSRNGMAAALSSGVCDLIGVARPAAINARFSKDLILNPTIGDAEAVLHLPRVKLHGLQARLNIKGLSGGAETQFYRKNIERLSLGQETLIPSI